MISQLIHQSVDRNVIASNFDNRQIIDFIKQKCRSFSGSNLLNVVICCSFIFYIFVGFRQDI